MRVGHCRASNRKLGCESSQAFFVHYILTQDLIISRGCLDPYDRIGMPRFYEAPGAKRINRTISLRFKGPRRWRYTTLDESVHPSGLGWIHSKR